MQFRDILEDLSRAERESFERLLEPLRFEAGETLFVQGAPADGVYFVRSGRIQLGVWLPGGDLSDLAVVGPGEVMGELLLGSGARTATAVAIEAVETGFMRREEFLTLYDSFDRASFKFLYRVTRSVALRLVSTNQVLGPGPPIGDAGAGPPPGLTSGAFFDPRPFLPKLPFFREFSVREIETLLEHSELYEGQRGCMLFHAGDPADAAYIVVRGAVEVLVGSDDALERICLLGPGTIVGDVAALLDAPRTATCRVRARAVLLRLPAEAFPTLLDPQHKIAFKFLRALLSSLVHSIERTNRTLAGREHMRRSIPAPPVGGDSI